MQHLGIEQTIKACGETYRLCRFSRRLLRLWFEWADAQIPDPLAIAEDHLAGFPDPDLLIGAAETMLLDRFSFNDPSLWELWKAEEGVAYAFSLLFDPGIDTKPIFDAVGVEEARRLLAKANGIPPVDPTEIDTQYYQAIGLMPQRGEAPIKTIPWHEFDASLFQNLHLTPDQIDALTPTEIVVLTRKEEKGRTLQEGLELLKIKAKLTTAQRLELAQLKQAN